MPEISSNWAKTLEPTILEYLQDGYKEHSDFTPEIFNVMDRTAGVTRFKDMFGPKYIPISSENAATDEASFTDGYETVVRPVIFKSKMGISEEESDWNQYPDTLDKARALGEAGIQTVNAYGANAFVNAFNTSYTEYGDGLPLCSTAHTRPDGGSNISNASSTSIALSEANLETGMTALKQTPSGTGRKLAIGDGNIILMVPEELDKEAVIITGSNLRSGTANNDLNWYRGKISVFVNPFIGSDVSDVYGNSGSDTHWFLLARGVHKLRLVWDMRPAYKNWEDNDKDTMWTKIKFRGKVTWSDFRGVYGSKGDGTSYSS